MGEWGHLDEKEHRATAFTIYPQLGNGNDAHRTFQSLESNTEIFGPFGVDFVQGDRYESNFITPASVIEDAVFPPVFRFGIFVKYLHACTWLIEKLLNSAVSNSFQPMIKRGSNQDASIGMRVCSTQNTCLLSKAENKDKCYLNRWDQSNQHHLYCVHQKELHSYFKHSESEFAHYGIPRRHSVVTMLKSYMRQKAWQPSHNPQHVGIGSNKVLAPANWWLRVNVCVNNSTAASRHRSKATNLFLSPVWQTPLKKVT
ncbi:hypothetical protein STEG23_005324 [Scotinomys teguina]